jgi:hypothetical protein
MVQKEKQKEKGKKFNALALKTTLFSMIACLAMVVPACATYSFTGNLSDIGQVITDFLTLQDELLQLVIFGVVMTAAGAIGGFITGFFGVIIGNLRR